MALFACFDRHNGVDNGDNGDNGVDNGVEYGAGDETWGMSSRTSGRSMVERGDGEEPAAPGVVVVVVAVVVDRNPGEHVEDDIDGEQIWIHQQSMNNISCFEE